MLRRLTGWQLLLVQSERARRSFPVTQRAAHKTRWPPRIPLLLLLRQVLGIYLFILIAHRRARPPPSSPPPAPFFIEGVPLTSNACTARGPFRESRPDVDPAGLPSLGSLNSAFHPGIASVAPRAAPHHPPCPTSLSGPPCPSMAPTPTWEAIPVSLPPAPSMMEVTNHHVLHRTLQRQRPQRHFPPY